MLAAHDITVRLSKHERMRSSIHAMKSLPKIHTTSWPSAQMTPSEAMVLKMPPTTAEMNADPDTLEGPFSALYQIQYSMGRPQKCSK